MIKTKETDKGILHYSDLDMKIRQIETGIVYDSADDILPCPYTYEETDIPIEPIDEPKSDDYYEGYDDSTYDSLEDDEV